MKHLGLFEGIGGFSYAARLCGIETVFTSEINPFCRRVLQYHFPNAYHAGDIHEITKEFIYEKAQINESDRLILTGGFPCQPFSIAGKRKGTNDSRHLWPQMLRIIKELKPRFIVGENVGGFVNWSDGEVFELVCNDLETEGYEVQAFEIPACAVGAPHIRNRVWIIANRMFAQRKRKKRGFFKKPKNRIVRKNWIIANAKSADNKYKFEQSQVCKQEQRQFRRSNIENSDSAKYRFPALSQSPFCSPNDGLPAGLDGITFSKWRNESIKAYGNAIVPQIAYAIFQSIKETMAL